MIKLISNKKNLIIVIFSILMALLFEFLIFQKDAIIGGNKVQKLHVLKTKNMQKIGDNYITSGEDATIEFETGNAHINELSFNYSAISDFVWNLEVEDNIGNKFESINSSSSIIKIANRKVHFDSTKIIIKFYNKGLKISNFVINNKIQFNFVRFLFVFFGSLMALFTIFNREIVFKKIEYTFLIISIISGTLIILVTPFSAYTSNDDQVHFHNAYTLLDGDYSCWNNSERYYDKLILNAPDRFRTQEEVSAYIKYLNKNTKCVKKFNSNNNLSYGKLIYLPQGIIMKLCKILHVPFVINLFLAKFINLLVYTILIFFAIKVIPFCKKTIFVIGLLPTALYLATQFSYDPPITGACILSLAFYFKMLDSSKINSNDFILFVLSLCWSCLPKAIYCPLFLLPIFINREKFIDDKQRKNIKLISIYMFILFMSTFVLPALLGSVGGDYRIADSSVSGQLKYIFANPINYIKILFKYTLENLSDFFFGYGTFSKMGYVISIDYSYMNLFSFITLFTVFYVIFVDECSKEIITKKIKIIFSILLVIIWCLIGTALYLSWTPVGSDQILGVQGRYFIPILLLMFMLIKPGKDPKKISDNKNIMIILLPIIVIFFDIMVLLNIYHV